MVRKYNETESTQHEGTPPVAALRRKAHSYLVTRDGAVDRGLVKDFIMVLLPVLCHLNAEAH